LIELKDPSPKIAPYQTRQIRLTLHQNKRIIGDTILVELALKSGNVVSLVIPVKHLSRKVVFAPNNHIALKQTHFSPFVSKSLVLPPLKDEPANNPPLLALHGAGVDLAMPFWSDSIPRQKHSWIVLPTGGTSWGYDWKGPSIPDVLAAIAALRGREEIGEGLVVMGHSNGGQGSTYLASRYPDLIRAVLPASAYLSSSLYVSTAYARGLHFTGDPALNSILEASLAGGNNDIFLSNLVRSKVRLVHGGLDENVPVWNSRETLSIVKSWDVKADVEWVIWLLTLLCITRLT
jgi:pimeloyl-ACP methyl ester carboxylesterase